jgi:phosphoenolpyruvate synthase/pyruvate phosphate dikinase
VIINTIIPLNQAGDYPSRQVGKYTYELIKIKTIQNNVANGFVIPVETFKKIAHHNNLLEKIKLIEETNDWNNQALQAKFHKKIVQLIKKQQYPEDVAIDILKAYKKYFSKNEFVTIHTKTIAQDNIQGENNLLESILEVWATGITKLTLFKKPQLIQVQKQPEISGYIIPKKALKNRTLIKAVQGVFDENIAQKDAPDLFEVDTSYHTVITRQLHPRTHMLVRQLDGLKKITNKQINKAALSDKLALELAELGQKINRQFIGSKKIYFEINGKTITITALKDLQDTRFKKSDPLLIGQSVTGGFVEGIVQIVETERDKIAFRTGHVLVKRTLTYQDLSLLQQAAAIIIEDKKITPAVLEAIQNYHLPCVIGVNYATEKLKNNQLIRIDSGAGKIYPPVAEKKQAPSQTTITKVFLSAGNPFSIEQYKNHHEGIFLKSDYAIAFMGIHPNHLLKNKKTFFEQHLTKTIEAFFTDQQKNLFYRSCNLNSMELSTLSQSLNYEKQELNPYLGTRGAVRIIEDSQLFEKELSIVNNIAQHQKREVHFVLPFVRTASELALIFKIIEKTVPKNNYLKFWLQLNTPANVINLSEFLHLPIAGVTVQAKTIHDLTYGLDPDNPELLRHYAFDNALIEKMLSMVVDTIKDSIHFKQKSVGMIPVILKLNHYSSRLVEKATQLGIRAIVVKPSLLDIVKQQIVETEKNLITHR